MRVDMIVVSLWACVAAWLVAAAAAFHPGRLGAATLHHQRAVPLFAEPMLLTEDNVELVLEEARQTLGSMFGNSAENRGVGITGEVEFVELDGPSVVIALKGRFWHKRTDVLARVGSFLQERIPEVISVNIADPAMLTDGDDAGPGAEPSGGIW